jgi:hypothetical protein
MSSTAWQRSFAAGQYIGSLAAEPSFKAADARQGSQEAREALGAVGAACRRMALQTGAASRRCCAGRRACARLSLSC